MDQQIHRILNTPLDAALLSALDKRWKLLRIVFLN
jgi:hypothetical protein